MSLKTVLSILFIFIILFSCDSKKNQENNLSDKDSLIQSDLDSAALKFAPEWFITIPQSDTVFYAAATARSFRSNIARDKALMKAQVKLAEKFKGTGSPGGADEGEHFNNDLDIILQDVITVEHKQVQDGKYWRAYVLLKMKK